MTRFMKLALAAGTSACAMAAAAQETTSYTYDALGRLTSTSVAGSINGGKSRSLCYDAAGNRKAIATAVTGTADCASVASPTPTPTPSPAYFAINDASAVEGSAITFTVTRSGSLTGADSIQYSSAYLSASSADFTAVSGTLSFAAGIATRTFTVATINDSLVEGTETFRIDLSNPSAGTIVNDAQGTGTITDNDYNEDPDPPGGGCLLVDQEIKGETTPQIQMMPPDC